MSNPDHKTDSQHEEEDRCYRPARGGYYFSIGFIIFWVVVGIASMSAVVIQNGGVFPRTLLIIVIMSIFFSIPVGMGVLFKKSYLKSKLIITPENITRFGLSGITTIRFDEIETATWGSKIAEFVGVMGGFCYRSLQLRSDSTKQIEIQIDIQSYSEEHQREIVYLLHSAIDEDIQNHWDKFEELHYSVPESIKAHYWKHHLYFQLLLVACFVVSGLLLWVFNHDIFLGIAIFALMGLSWDLLIFRKAVRRYREARNKELLEEDSISI